MIFSRIGAIMKNSENKSVLPIVAQNATDAPQPWDQLPFAGLGFDLSPVFARRVTLAVPLHRRSFPLRRWNPAPNPAGIGLQVRLCREIRGS